MKKYLSALMLLGASMTIVLPSASAQDASPAPKKAAKKPVKKTAKKAVPKKKDAAPAVEADEDDQEPDIAASSSTDFNCELGNKLTIYENAIDDRHIALRWNKRLHRLTRISTSTGAKRFENRKQGLVWIGIPSKGMLLDSKKGLQLANECKTPQQMMQVSAPAPASPDATVVLPPADGNKPLAVEVAK